MPTSTPPATIADVLPAFLSEQRARLSAPTYRRYEEIVELLQMYLNGYGHQLLDTDDRARVERAYDAGDEAAFCHLFGPEMIPRSLGMFLNDFMIRKVAYPTAVKAAGPVTKKLMTWLAEQGYVEADEARAAREIASDGTRDLPAAGRLGDLLYRLAGESPPVDLERLGPNDYVDDYLMIERVEPGKLYFEGGFGPLSVPEEASDLARSGWTVNVVLVRTPRGWTLLEVGNVYPT